MDRRSSHQLRIILGVITALASSSRSSAEAGERACVYLDGGVGGSRSQPHITGGAVCGTVGLGASSQLQGPVWGWIETRATIGGDFPTGIPEHANAGRQSVVTLVIGFEFLNQGTVGGPFFMSGLGVGRSSISGARGPTTTPGFLIVPPTDRAAAAYSVGFGYRFSGGPWSTRAQLAVRSHGLFHEGLSSYAYATALTIGVAL